MYMCLGAQSTCFRIVDQVDAVVMERRSGKSTGGAQSLERRALLSYDLVDA